MTGLEWTILKEWREREMFDRMPGEPDPYLEELKEQTRWLRFLGLRALAPLAQAQLKTENERIVYEHTDGVRSSRDVGAATGVPSRTVAMWWKRWTTAGIATADASGRARRLASLAQLG